MPKIIIKLPSIQCLKFKCKYIWWRLADRFVILYNTWKYDGRPVEMSTEYIKRWVLSDENWECSGTGFANDYAEHEYDQEILLAMFTLMGAPVYGCVKGIGCNSLLCYFVYDGCQHWAYLDRKDLVFLD